MIWLGKELPHKKLYKGILETPEIKLGGGLLDHINHPAYYREMSLRDVEESLRNMLVGTPVEAEPQPYTQPQIYTPFNQSTVVWDADGWANYQSHFGTVRIQPDPIYDGTVSLDITLA